MLTRRLQWPCWLLALIGLLAGAYAADSVFPQYRDLKVYTTSTPDERNRARIIARTQFVNEGTAAVKVDARLTASRTLRLAGGQFTQTIPAGKSADWTWSITVPARFTQEILSGSIDINDRRERDLFINVQGQDPRDFDDEFVERVTERARVVATYAPRVRASILAEMTARAAQRPQPLLTLAANGATDYAIVVEALPALPAEGEGDALAFWRQAELTAAQQDLVAAVDDLQRCLQVQSGAVLPIQTEAAAGPAIILREADPGAPAGLQDAYRLRTEGTNVFIKAAGPDGLRQGVYGLLTDHLDCHWFQPGQLGEEIVVPTNHTVRLPALNEVQGSPWLSCHGASFGGAPQWDRRNRSYVNRGRMGFGHAWQGFINNNQYPYDQFPEYYARDRQGKLLICDPPGGGTSTNFCSTNPEVIEIVAQKVNAYFARDPDAIVASLDPNDYAPMCLCDRCLALDKSYGVTQEDGKYVSDRLLHFSKEIYDRLEPRFKDKFLGILVYGFQMEVPKSAKGHANHAGMICNMTWEHDHSRPFNDPTSARNRQFYAQLKGWCEAIPQLGYYDYYGHFFYFGPWGMVQKMREDLLAFRVMGGAYLMLETQPIFAAQGLNHYIVTKLVWNLETDVDLAMEEFFTKYYGPASEPMREYWLAIERIYALERAGHDPLFRVGENPATWRELDGYLAKARQIAAVLPAEDKRFADRVTLASDGLEYGRLRYGYDSHYGIIASANLGRTVDHAAALTYLQRHGARMEELQQKYSTDDPYWPPLIAGYLRLYNTIEIKGHQEALEKGQ